MDVSTINHISEVTMAMPTTNNNMTTLTTSTFKSPLKQLHNEWIHVEHLQHPDEAAILPIPGIQDIKWVELYDKFRMLIPVEYHKEWFYFTTPPQMERYEKLKANKKGKRH